MASPAPLRRELLFSFAVLFGGAVLLAVLGVLVLLPFLDSPAAGILFIGILVAADLVVLFAFGSATLRSRLVEPVEALVSDVERIAAGAHAHRVRPMPSRELGAIEASVNAMADRLVHDQELLAENVASLERTNRELVEARDQVVSVARLASVGSLAAGIAHEVGNPLGAILAYVDVARSRAERAGRDTEVLDSIREEARRIDRIVRGLLDYARPREEKPTAVSPATVVQRVRELLANQGRLDGVRSTWKLDCPDIPTVHMEPHRLEQVLVNLLLNALDALEGREDGCISVELEVEPGAVRRLPPRREDDPPGINYMHRRRVSRDEGGKGIDPLFTAERVAVIRVSDNGPGIPPGNVERLFDPFFTTKEPGRGTGLGLSIGARLVEGMGGRIEASNRPEGGAVFTVRLPGSGGVGAPTVVSNVPGVRP